MHQSQKKNINVMIFEEDQLNRTQPTRINDSPTTQQSNYCVHEKEPYQSPIQALEISQLSEKINSLQDKAQQIQQVIKQLNSTFNISPTLSPVNSSSSFPSQQLSSQLIFAIEKKTNIICVESKKIIQKLANEYTDKINKISQQKNKCIQNLQNVYHNIIQQIKLQFLFQQKSIIHQFKIIQNQLISRIQNLQKCYEIKLQQLSNKQKQYQNIIKYLQHKIQQMTQSKQPSQNNDQHKQQQISSTPKQKNKNKKRIKIFENIPFGSDNNSGLNLFKYKYDSNVISFNPQRYQSQKFIPANYQTTPKSATAISHSQSNRPTTFLALNSNIMNPPSSTNALKQAKTSKKAYKKQNFLQATQKQFLQNIPTIQSTQRSQIKIQNCCNKISFFDQNSNSDTILFQNCYLDENS